MTPREEMYLLSAEKFERDCAYISACEDSLVGQAVVARNDENGLFYLGKFNCAAIIDIFALSLNSLSKSTGIYCSLEMS